MDYGVQLSWLRAEVVERFLFFWTWTFWHTQRTQEGTRIGTTTRRRTHNRRTTRAAAHWLAGALVRLLVARLDRRYGPLYLRQDVGETHQ